MRWRLSLLLGLLLIPSAAWAAKYTITSVRFEDMAQRDKLRVRFAKPLPVEKDLLCATGSVCPWLVIVVHRDGTASTALVSTAIVPTGTGSLGFPTDHEVTLHLSQAIAAEFSRVTVTYLGGDAPTQSLTVFDNTKPKPLVPTDKADDATIFFSGLIAPAVNSHTTYTIDAKGSWVFGRVGKDQAPISITGVAKSDKRPEVDLDSFVVGGTWANYAHKLIYRWDFSSVEFNRKAQVANLVSAFRLTAPLSKTWFSSPTKDGKSGPTLRAVVGLDVGVGVETGLNLKDELVTRDSRALLRGVASASGFIAIPAPWVKRFVVSGEVTGRFLATDKLFLETRNLLPKADPVPTLDGKPRIYAKAAVKFMLSPWVGVQLAYERGCLPPSFRFIDSSGTIGFVFQAKQPDTRR